MTDLADTLADEMTARLKDDVLFIETNRSVEETEAFCTRHAPWRSVYRFSNGVTTESFPRSEHVPNPRCLAKLRRFHARIDLSRFAGKRVLDLGFNEGYQSIFMAKYLGCQVDGIEAYQVAVDRTSAIAEFCGAPCKFWVADANSFVAPETYDVILHCGLLYHLHDVWSAVKNSCRSLKPGGEVLLETTSYEGADKFDCKFMNWHAKGNHNYWALSPETIRYLFAEFGCTEGREVDSFEVGALAGTGMKRTMMWFRKPA
ncbi:class I SAM-dependent methyltransferase [Rhodovulum sulfidophilum]|uniref:class I SAM-dependent methyltransferase n=1 Tax=Rhodovulum sulfidophilum TaxID=35806 RepID=UPI001922205D|nr:class I SAM-dependent methyltransferase [Rhodovulum sulfidophilum]MBL3565472.1 class I SAM-dependent methyltransferase [Rhodovulum sulfidophilum]